MKQIRIFLLLITVLAGLGARAAKPTLKAKLDSATMQMGRLGTLRLEVVTDAGAKGNFPMLATPAPEGYLPLCGDSVELRTSYKADTIDLGSGRRQINFQFPIQSFDSGFYRLPEFIYVSGRDTARSNRVSLKILPVSLEANAEIAPLADPADPIEKSIFDKLPDFLYYYWWVIVLVLLVAGAAFWILRRRRQNAPVLKKKKPQPTPYEIAMRDLNDLKERKLWEQGLEREYFTRLTEILRNYLDGRFGINAMEMTSAQIIRTLSDNPEVSGKRDYVRNILNMADFVKFAKMRPLPDDNIEAYVNAVKFVQETKPVSAEPKEQQKDCTVAAGNKGKEAAK